MISTTRIVVEILLYVNLLLTNKIFNLELRLVVIKYCQIKISLEMNNNQAPKGY